jgi:hypothetical protein
MIRMQQDNEQSTLPTDATNTLAFALAYPLRRMQQSLSTCAGFNDGCKFFFFTL